MVSCEHGNKFWNYTKDRISKAADLFLACISCSVWSLFLIATTNALFVKTISACLHSLSDLHINNIPVLCSQKLVGSNICYAFYARR
jgi:hypothetical protein